MQPTVYLRQRQNSSYLYSGVLVLWISGSDGGAGLSLNSDHMFSIRCFTSTNLFVLVKQKTAVDGVSEN